MMPFQFFADAPDEIFTHNIFQYLDRHGLRAMSLVSKRFSALAKNHGLWRDLIKRDFGFDTTADDKCLKKYFMLLCWRNGKEYFYRSDNFAKTKSLAYFNDLFEMMTELTKEMPQDSIDAKWINQLWGEMYYYGYGVPENKALGLDYLKAAAEAGNTDAMMRLYSIYIDSYWLQEAHLGGNPTATLILAQAYSTGSPQLDIQRDFQMSRALLEANIAKGHAESAYELTAFLFSLLPRDMSEILALLEKAVKWGSTDAAIQLAQAYSGELFSGFRGLVPVNPNLALRYLKRAAERESAQACLFLGRRFSGKSEGTFAPNIPIQQNMEEAIRWLERAAEFAKTDEIYTFNESIQLLIGIYGAGEDGIEFSLEKVLFWGERALKKGSNVGLLAIGKLYLFGNQHLRADKLKAENWFQRAFDCSENSAREIAEIYFEAEDLRRRSLKSRFS